MSYTRNILSLLCLFCLLSVIALTSCSDNSPCCDDGNYPGNDVSNTNCSATESFSYEIPVQNQRRFILEAINGSIDVTGVSGASVAEIWGERRVESESTTDAEEHLYYLEVRVINNEDEVCVRTVQPDKSCGRNYEVTYHVRLPIDWNVAVDNINGNIDIDSFNSCLSVDLVNGNTHLSEILGPVNINIVNGYIISQMTLPEDGRCSMDIVNGGIQLSIPTNTSAVFSAGVINGTVAVNGLPLHDIESTPFSICGILADGRGTINLNAVNGNLNVSGH